MTRKRGLGISRCFVSSRAYRAIFGFRDEPPDDEGLDGVLDREDDVCLPGNILQSHGPGELVEEPADIDGQGGEGHALGTHFKGKHLNREQGLKRSNPERVYAT